MNNTDIIALLTELWEHFDRTSDIDSDGSPNASLRFCSEIDEAIKSLTNITRDLYTVAGRIDGWKQDVCLGLKPLLHNLQNGEREVLTTIAKLEGRHV